MNIQEEDFQFIDSVEPNLFMIVFREEFENTFISVEKSSIDTLDLYENDQCVTITKEDAQKFMEYFNSLSPPTASN